MTTLLGICIAVFPVLALILASIRGHKKAIKALLFLCVFLADSRFRTRGITATGIDWQLGLLLGLWFGAGLAGFLGLFGRWGCLVRRPGSLMVIFLAYGSLSVAFAPDPMFSGAALLTSWACLFFAGLVTARLTWEEICWTALAAMVMYLAVSLVLYWVVPEFGQHRHLVSTLGLEYQRLKGLSHPNKIGWMAAASIGIATLLPGNGAKRGLRISIVLLGFVSLMLAASRTAILGLVLALVVHTLLKRPSIWIALGAIGVSVIGLALAFGWAPDTTAAMSLLLRSQAGDPQQVATLTGRTILWATVLMLIRGSPLFGYGFASNKALLVSRFEGQYFVPDQAHNEYLNLTLTMGLLGLLTHLLIMLHLIFSRQLRSAQPLLFVVILTMISGLAESYLFTGLPTTPQLMWMLAVLLGIKDVFPPQVHSRPKVNRHLKKAQT